MLDDHFGFLIQKTFVNDPIPGPVGWSVRRESDAEPLYTLHTGATVGVKVSPDGRRMAYWTNKDLRVLDVAPTAQPRTLLTVAANESALYMAWSSDGTGLVVGVNGAQAQPAPDGPPAYTALRVVDAAGGKATEITRVPSANVLPVSWDRKAGLIGAYEPLCCGTANYDTVTEAGVITRTPPGLDLFFLEGSGDAQQVFGRSLFPSTMVRVWPTSSYARGVELRTTGGEEFLYVGWRPGSTEIGVLFTDRLEFWNANGTRRTVWLPADTPGSERPKGVLVFREDGNAVFIAGLLSRTMSERVIAVDVTSGNIDVIDWMGVFPEPGSSVRLGA